METKQRFITMFIALVAMFMGTLRVNAISPNGGAVIAEKDFTGGFEGNYPNWYRFGDDQEGSISSDPDGVAITVGSKTGNLWQPQLRVIDEEIQLREGGNYKVVVTAKFPCNGQLQINMGSWSGNEQYPVDVVSTGEFQEVEINFLDYPYNCNNSGGVGDAHVLIHCGDFLGTTIVKKIQVWDLDAGPYAVLSGDGKTLTFYCDGNKSSNVYDLNEGNSAPEWIQNTSIETVAFDETFASARPVSTYSWFNGLTSLGSIVNIENLNTSEVTTMARMFFGCSSLTSIKLSGFNTSNVESTSFMFSGCHELTSLDISSFDTSNVLYMNSMFNACNQLKTITVGELWTTANVEESGHMFSNCTSLVGGAGTIYDENHVDQDYAHIDGLNGKPGYLTVAPDAYAVLSDDGKTLTFYCDGNKSTYEPSNVYDLNEGDNLPGWNGITTVETVVFEESFATVRPVSTRSWFDCFEVLTEIVGMEYLNTSEVTTMEGMFGGCKSITNLDLSHFNTSKVTNMEAMFNTCHKLKEINLRGFDTSNVTSMQIMFLGCVALETLNLESFNTSSATSMALMFSGCSMLRTIYVGDGWSVANANCFGMFTGCVNLTGGEGTTYDAAHQAADYAHIDGGESDPGYLTAPQPEAYAVYNISSDNVSTLTFYYDNLRNTIQRVGIKKYDLNEGYVEPGWISDNRYVEKVVFDESFKDARPTSTFCWFSGNQDLDTFVGWENLNTSEVTNMSQMFKECSSLTSVTLSGFDTQNVTDMSQMFNGCSGLTSISLSGFNTQNVTNMSHMFFGCSSLTSIKLSGLNTSNVMYANFMFSGCQGLTSLDLSSFDTSNVRYMNNMFGGCGNLKTITVGVNWTTDNVPVASSSNMFSNCPRLVGGAGTTYNSGKVDKEYAIADGLNGQPGYLTAVSYGITVSGKAVTFVNKYDVLGNETVYYDDDLNILTLHNANVTSINIASAAPNDLHVNVVGECKVRIEGIGKLTIISEKGIGININRQRAAGLLVKDVDLEVAGYKAGIAGTVNATGRTFYSSLGFDNANCIVGSLQEAAASVTAIKMLECIRCSMTAGKFDKVNHKVEANPMIIQRSGGISTDIDAIDNGQLTIDKSLPLYNLNGQRVSHPVKGQIYIQNGRKIKF